MAYRVPSALRFQINKAPEQVAPHPAKARGEREGPERPARKPQEGQDDTE